MRLLLLLLLNVFLSASVTAQTPKESTCFSFPAIIGANCNGEVKQVSVIRHPVVKDACKRPGYNFKYLWIFKRTSGEQSRLYSDGVMTVEIPVNTDSVEFCYWLEVNGSQITPMISAINVIAVDQIQCNTCSDSTNITV
ncbi:MAG TPA: hypothetical protein PJ990_16875, partial [Saprospiraceae bacterium]|nr:hypothetical protein [Saprospiraceae bacterium]